MKLIEFKDLPNTDTPINAENLNKMQDNIENQFSDYIKIINANKNIGIITAGADLYDQTIDITSLIPTGYSAIGIVGVDLYGGYYSTLALNRHVLNNNIITFALKNTHSANTNDINIIFKVLCIKNQS